MSSTRETRLEVREGSPEARKEEIRAVLAREIPDWGGESKFRWLYEAAPFGAPRVWLLTDDEGRIVGVSSAFPRRMRSGQRSLAGWVLGDFCVAKEHRSLGPAVKLQRATLQAVVERGDGDVYYDFPSRTMLAVYQRLGVRSGGEFARFVKPLTVERLVERRVSTPVVAKGLSAVGNALLTSRDAVRPRGDRSRVREWTGDDLEELARVAKNHAFERGMAVERSARYLDWRHLSDPRGASTLLVVSGHAGIELVLALREEARDWQITDVFGDPSAVAAVVAELGDRARARGVESLSVVFSEAHPFVTAFEALGFRKRESSRYVVGARRGLEEQGLDWFLMTADRDL